VRDRKRPRIRTASHEACGKPEYDA
jgi:hypothetical protein